MLLWVAVIVVIVGALFIYFNAFHGRESAFQIAQRVTQDIVVRSVPVVAQELYDKQRKPVIEIPWLDNNEVQQCYIVNDAAIAKEIFESGSNFSTRFGDNEGLRRLGMHSHGVIWNTDYSSWHGTRKCFQKSLSADCLNSAIGVAAKATISKFYELDNLVEAKKNVDLLQILRSITLEITLDLFLGIPVGTLEFSKQLEIVDRICKYFEAWSYYLLRPPTMYDESQTKIHDKSVENLRASVTELNTLAQKSSDNFAQFIDSKNLEDHDQCILEMLLAGTDTSSVSMFYFFYAIADEQESKAREWIDSELKSVDALIKISDGKLSKPVLDKLSVITAGLKESMRVKPVGPVALRKARATVKLQNGIVLKEGNNVIINLASIHAAQSKFSPPHQFRIENYLNDELELIDTPYFQPFGTGQKGCVGQFLAMIEMKSICYHLLSRYEFRVPEGSPTLLTMETFWDVANQPKDDLPLVITRKNP